MTASYPGFAPSAPARIIRFIRCSYFFLLVMTSMLCAGLTSTYLHAQADPGKGLIAVAVQASKRPSAPSVNLVQSPLSFEPNIGQDSSAARYIADGPGYLLRLEASRASIDFTEHLGEKKAADVPNRSTLALNIVGGDTAAAISATEKLQGKHSYFPAGDPKSWIPNVPTYGRVNYENIYRGIDLSFYGNASRLEYDFILRPGSDANTIQLALDGAEQVKLEKNGKLSLSVHGSALTLLRPIAYQPSADGSKQPVEVHYRLRPADKRTNTTAMLSFRLGAYDRSKPLIIDPVLIYGIDIPGAPGYAYPPYYFPDTAINAMTADPHGNTYIAAKVLSSNSNYSVLKFDPAGNLLFNVSLGSGDVQASPQAIAVDAAGDIYLVGSAGQGLPTTAGAFQPAIGLPSNNPSGFLTVIQSDASALTYSTYLGGNDTINGVAVDSSGKAYVTGSTSMTDFPTTSGVYQPTAATNYSNHGFVAKLDPLGSGSSSLVYSTFLAAVGGYQDTSVGIGIAVDHSGNAYVIEDATPDYPVTQGAYSFKGISSTGAYVTKLNPTGSGLVYSAFLGPGSPAAITLDGNGGAYIVGSVNSAEFPTTPGAYQTTYAGGFAAKLSSDGSSLLYSTFLSGPGGYQAFSVNPTSVAILPGCLSACDAYISGTTFTTDFPLINPIQSFPGNYVKPSPNSRFDTGFLVSLGHDGKSAVYSTYLGAATSPTSVNNKVPGIAADSTGNIYFASNISGFDAPVSLPAVQNPGQGFLLKIGSVNAGAVVAIPSQIAFDAVQAVNSTSANPTAVQLRNMGSQAITLQRPFLLTSKEFSETDNCSSSFPAGGICTLSVSFTPTASGQRAATLTISSNAPNSPAIVSLSGTAVDGPNLIVSATLLTFADQIVKSTSAAQIVTLTNSGNQPQPITAITAATPDYIAASTCPAQIAAGASCQMTVKFSPTQIGLRSGDIFIQEPGYSYNNGYSYPNGYYVYLTGTGVLSATGSGSLTLSETAINFGSLVVGGNAGTQSIALMNTGATPVTINSITAATNANQGGAGDFLLVPASQSGPTSCGYSPITIPPYYGLPFELAPQSSCSIQVAFQPSTSGQEAGTLQVADSASGSPHTIGLSGIGLLSVQPLTVNPATMAFPAQPLDDPSAPQTFSVSNTGEDFVIIDRAFATGDFVMLDPSSSSCEGVVLGPLSSCTLSVAFDPTAVGSRTGTLTVIDALSSTPHVFNLIGTGIQSTGALMLGQSSLVFSAQAKGTTSRSKEIVVSNPGNSPATINSLAITGDFAVTSQSQPYNKDCGGVLAPDSTCQILIAFSPTQPNGTETGTLTVHSTVGTLTVNLSGTSFTTPQAIHLTPTTINFGSVKIGTPAGPSNQVIVYIENTGSEPVTFSNPPTITGISPAPGADFSLSNGNCYTYVPLSYLAPMPLPPGQSCNFTIAFSPSSQTTEKATFTLVDSAGTQAIALSGMGVATVPAVTIQPATLSFDQLPVGSSTPPYVYSFIMSLYNNGTQPITITSQAVTAGSSDFSTSNLFGSCAGRTIVAGSYCNTGFVFHPSVLGYRTGSVIFKDSTGHTYSAALAGYAISEVNSASLTPQTLILPSTSLQSPANNYSPIVLNNNGNAPLTVGSISDKNVSPAGDFSSGDGCSGATVQPGGGCTVNVRFTPLATGTRIGSLTFPVTYADKTTASLTAALSGTGLPNVASANLLPQATVFADQVAGATNVNYQNAMQLVLTNAGTLQLTVGTLSGTNLTATPGSGGDFTKAYDNCSLQTLAPGRTCTVSLNFWPLTPGNKTGTVTLPVTYAGGKTATFTSALSGNSVAPAPALQLSPPGLQFNVEVVGTTDVNNVQNVALTDTGNAPVKISSITASQNFTVTSNGCYQPVQPHWSCYVTVGFTPLASTAPGPTNGTLTIVDNAPGSPHTVKLSGTAISVAQQLALSQTSVSFGSQTVSTASAPQVVYLTDLGSSGTSPYGSASRIQIKSIKLGGANASDFALSQNCGGTLGFTIAGRKGCMITVAFTPGKSSFGTRTASVTITPAQGSPLAIQLVGIGVSPAPAATIFPASLTFATRPVGSASQAQVFSVTNTGTAALSVAQVLTTHPSEFSITSDGCSGKSLAPGVKCLVSVSFNPGVAGPLTAMLQLKDNAGSSLRSAALSGTGAKGAQAIIFRSRERPAVGMPSIDLLATATSGLPVGYELVSGPAVLEGNILKPASSGFVVVRATQPGDDKFAPAQVVEHTFIVRREPITPTPIVKAGPE